ncbi:MAG: GYD domain-containing protein [Candidatus Latescibacteria bacterium]|nr:GYD domain-containing protein [Candidatus Latescibacterota bacterium]
MVTYIMLLNWTQQGIQDIKNSPKRVDSAKKAFRGAGAKLKEFYMAMGRYDMAVIAEAPDEETMARVALMLSSAGNVRTETLKAFTEAEYRKIIGSLP